MSEQNNSDEAIFVYDDSRPGVIMSRDGLHVGQHVVIIHEGKQVNVNDIIRFDDSGYIKKIELNNNGGMYCYRVDAVGAGPVYGYGRTFYTDGEPDTYELKFWKRAEHSDRVKFNSTAPVIYKIQWDPIARIKKA